ncbi:hypothetical protein Mapa_007802 [Marchantia paleacea]|nr:hypothetical protein Mapa_007802 [Marchantia paleacea]
MCCTGNQLSGNGSQILKLGFMEYICDPAIYLDIINARNGTNFQKTFLNIRVI